MRYGTATLREHGLISRDGGGVEQRAGGGAFGALRDRDPAPSAASAASARSRTSTAMACRIRLLRARFDDRRQRRIERRVVAEAAVGRVREHLAHAGLAHREGRRECPDVLMSMLKPKRSMQTPISTPVSACVTPPIGYGVSMVAGSCARGRRSRSSSSRRCGPRLALDDHGRQARHADLLDQRPEIALEDLVGKLFLGRPLPTGHEKGADGHGEAKKPEFH